MLFEISVIVWKRNTVNTFGIPNEMRIDLLFSIILEILSLRVQLHWTSRASYPVLLHRLLRQPTLLLSTGYQVL